MAYTSVKTPGAYYEVDWDVIERFCMSYWSTYYQSVYSEITTMSESSWYNPFSWSLPEIKTVEVNWDKVRDASRSACASDMFTYGRNASRDMRDIAYEMKWKVEQTAFNKQEFARALKSVQSQNARAIESSVDTYSGLIEASRFIRNTSADIVAIGSTIASGGAAAGLLAGSSVLKGCGKYQDTGKAGSAILYGTGSMVLGAFKLGGAKLTTRGDYTLIMAQGVLESGTSLAAGDSFAKAVERGGLKIASSGAAHALFSTSVVKTVFAKMPVPFNVFSEKRNSAGYIVEEDVANGLVGHTAKKLTEKGAKALFGAGLHAMGAAGDVQPRVASAGFIDEVPVEQMLLLYLAIVHMGKGIGRGW